MNKAIETANLPEIDGDWSIGEDAIKRVIAEFDSINPANIVEFGSGKSTVWLASHFRHAQVLSIEHSNEYALESRRLLREYQCENAEVMLRPLALQTWEALPYLSYRLEPFPDEVDAVLIDGPPSHSTVRGREACLHQIFPALRIGAKVVLDDYGREGEQRIVGNWLATYPGCFEVKPLDIGHGLCVLTKVKEADRQFDARVAVDHLLGISASLWTQAKIKVSEIIRG